MLNDSADFCFVLKYLFFLTPNLFLYPFFLSLLPPSFSPSHIRTRAHTHTHTHTHTHAQTYPFYTLIHREFSKADSADALGNISILCIWTNKLLDKIINWLIDNQHPSPWGSMISRGLRRASQPGPQNSFSKASPASTLTIFVSVTHFSPLECLHWICSKTCIT